LVVDYARADGICETVFIKDRVMPATKLKYCMHLILGIRHSIGAENLIPEEVNHSKIAIRVPPALLST
jgi:hypothetical protein